MGALDGKVIAITGAGRGIGRALVQHTGATLLAPTPATVPFYEALGFRLLRYPADRTFYVPCRA